VEEDYEVVDPPASNALALYTKPHTALQAQIESHLQSHGKTQSALTQLSTHIITALNVARLKAYKERLIVFPRHPKKPKKGDATGDDLKAKTTHVTLPLPTAFEHEAPCKITEEERDFQAYRTLHNAHADVRYAGAKTARKQKVRYILNVTNLPIFASGMCKNSGGSL
jgi:Ribosomal protein L13e